MKIFASIFLLLLVFSIKTNAQFLEVKEPLTVNDGLSQNYITSIYQDSMGFIWFGTKDGLNRYDGHEFKVFKNNVHDPSSLSGNFVKVILEDGNHNLWIGTIQGLSKYNLMTGRFEQSGLPDSLIQTFRKRQCVSLAVDRRNTLWIGTDKGVFSLSLADNRFTDYSKTGHPLAGLSMKIIYRIAEDSEGKIWFSTPGSNLHGYDPQANSLNYLDKPVDETDYRSTLRKIAKEIILTGASRRGIQLYTKLKNGCEPIDQGEYSYYKSVRQVVPYRGTEYFIGSGSCISIFNRKNSSRLCLGV